MKTLFMLLFLTSCSPCTVYLLDGKAMSWCEGKRECAKTCKNKGGVKEYTARIYCKCNNGYEENK